MEYRGNPRRTAQIPLCAVVLIGINSIVFFAGLLIPRLGFWMESKGCYSVFYLLHGREFYRLVTAAFLHAGGLRLAESASDTRTTRQS